MKDSDKLKAQVARLLREWEAARDSGNLQLSIRLWQQLTDARADLALLVRQGK